MESRPQASKARINHLLDKAFEIRQMYHDKLCNEKKINDTDFKRSLTEKETSMMHSRWSKDVMEWMSPECLKEYNDLNREADKLDKEISDRDFMRSLTEKETRMVHNRWMNDVHAWMSSDCLKE